MGWVVLDMMINSARYGPQLNGLLVKQTERLNRVLTPMSQDSFGASFPMVGFSAKEKKTSAFEKSVWWLTLIGALAFGPDACGVMQGEEPKYGMKVVETLLNMDEEDWEKSIAKTEEGFSKAADAARPVVINILKSMSESGDNGSGNGLVVQESDYVITNEDGSTYVIPSNSGRASGSQVKQDNTRVSRGPMTPQKERVLNIWENSYLGKNKAPHIFLEDNNFVDYVMKKSAEMRIMDPHWEFIVLGGEESSYDPSSLAGNPDHDFFTTGIDQFSPNTLFDVLKSCPEGDALRFMDYFGYSGEEAEKRLSDIRAASSRGYKKSPYLNEMIRGFAKQRTELTREQQYDMRMVRLKMQMDRLGWHEILSLPELIMLQVLPAHAQKMRDILAGTGKNSRLSYSERIAKMLSYKVADSNSPIYWQNPGFSGCKTERVWNETTQKYDYKRVEKGIKDYFTVGDMVNHYYSKSYPTVKDRDIFLAPIVALTFEQASSEFFNSTGKRLPIISGLRSLRKQKEIYGAKRLAPYLASAHFYGYALDIAFNERWTIGSKKQEPLTAEEEGIAVQILEKYGFHRPHMKGNHEANHFEFRGILQASEAWKHQHFMARYLTTLASSPTIAAIAQSNGDVQGFYLLAPPKGSTNPVAEMPATGVEFGNPRLFNSMFNL